MAKTSGLTTNFLSIVLLPLAGNAVEHITAVMVAMKNKMDLALGIAIGSSIQIALFVLPICVLFSWAIGNPFTLQLDGLGAPAARARLSPHCLLCSALLSSTRSSNRCHDCAELCNEHLCVGVQNTVAASGRVFC